jgi:hypothetical protein
VTASYYTLTDDQVAQINAILRAKAEQEATGDDVDLVSFPDDGVFAG